MLLTPEKWQKKNWQEKQMLVIVDNHIEWDKTNRSGVHFSNVLRTLTLGLRQQLSYYHMPWILLEWYILKADN